MRENIRKMSIIFTIILVSLFVFAKKDLVAETTEKIVKREDISYSPNYYNYIDEKSDNIVINGHTYDYDASAGASRSSTTVLKTGKEKIDTMFWSVQPPKGVIMGDYYGGTKLFDGGYEAYADVVVDKGKIVHIELNE